ncbi:MAG: EscU/YscU/HrcU family type III secretion system export apparatus switch protein, partial [Thalassolituus sp.]
MAEQDSSQEKTEEPTSRKLEKARDEGQVPRSKELGTTLVLVIGAVGLLMFGPFMTQRVTGMALNAFSFDRNTAFDTGMMSSYLNASILEAAIALAPWLLLVLVAAFAGPLLVGGWLFSSKAIMPKLDRLNPLSGLKRMFSMNSLVELFKAWAKVLVVGTVAWLVLMYFFTEAMAIQHQALEPAVNHAVGIILWSLLFLCLS